MTNQVLVLGVREIKKNKVVKKMCRLSDKFKRMVQAVCDIEEEITKNNLDAILSTSDRNKSLKIEKLRLKRRIMFQLDSFINDPETWIEIYGESGAHQTMANNGNGSNGGSFPKGKNKNKKNRQRTRQCRKTDVGKSPMSRGKKGIKSC